MFFYKFNQYTGKYYKYDSDYYDIFHPMFDEELHNKDIKELYCDKLVCAYCGTQFESRNKLFYHLGYNGIDIRQKDSYGVDSYQADDEMGEFGYMVSSNDNKIKKKKILMKRRKRRMKKYFVNDINNKIKNMRI